MHLGLKDISGTSHNWQILLGAVIAVYLTNNLIFHDGGDISTYIIIPMLWGIIAFIVLRLPKQTAACKSRLRSSLITLAAIAALSQIFISLLGSFYYGFGESPYDFTTGSILKNLIYVGTALIGMELSRAWLINRFSKKHLIPKLLCIAILYTFISIPLTRIINTGIDLETLQWTNSAFFPALVESLLASYLAYNGGPMPAIVYRGILQAFLWFCPALPDPEWMVQALIGTVVPLAALLIAERLCGPQERRQAKQRTQTNKKWALTLSIITGITIILMVLFSNGSMGFHPTVIVSSSMSPSIKIGDIAVIDETDTDAIREGDISEFKGDDGTSIVHRVLCITIENDGTRVFETKGDDNDSPDLNPVRNDQIEGTVLYTIPKIGWISIAIKGLFRR